MQDLVAKWAGMTTLKYDDGSTTTTTRDIASAATRYDGDLFAPMTNDDDTNCGYTTTLKGLIDQQFDLWKYGMAITAQVVFDAVCTCPKNKTTRKTA